MNNDIHKACPFCGEKISKFRVKCNYCGMKLDNNEQTTTTHDEPTIEHHASTQETDTYTKEKNISTLESIATLVLILSLASVFVFAVYALMESSWLYFIIGVAFAFNGLLIYSLLLVFCGIANTLLELNDTARSIKLLASKITDK